MLAHELRGEFLQEVLLAVGDPGMDRTNASLLAGALGFGKGWHEIAVEALGSTLRPSLSVAGAFKPRSMPMRLVRVGALMAGAGCFTVILRYLRPRASICPAPSPGICSATCWKAPEWSGFSRRLVLRALLVLGIQSTYSRVLNRSQPQPNHDPT